MLPSGEAKQFDPALLQTDLLRYADDFAARTSSGVEEYISRMDNVEARLEAMNWRISLNSAVLATATGANARVNLVDFLALSSLTRASLEMRAGMVTPPDALDLWLRNARLLETNAWKLAEAALTTEQLAELRSSIEGWINQTADSRMVFFRRPQEMASGIRQVSTRTSRAGSVFSLIGLDPTAGLDPAVREVTRTRLFAERALYAMERMPFLIRWQTELLTEQVLRKEQLTNALASAERLSRAVETASSTVEGMPDRVTAERKAILEAFEAQEGKLRELSAEAGRTLKAGEAMSTSLNTTIATFEGLMKRFGVGEPESEPRDTNAVPFNILDYAHTADRVTAMAQQLDALLKDASGTVEAPALDRRIAELNAVSARARAEGVAILNHAFMLGSALILIFFVCAFLFRRATAPRAPVRQPSVATARDRGI